MLLSPCQLREGEPHFSPHSTAKTNNKSLFLRYLVLSLSEVAFTSVHSEKTRVKMMMMIMMMIMNE